MDQRKQRGELGEEIARFFLKTKDFNIKEVNFVCPLGEIDIIALSKGELVFVEVRSRVGGKFGLPAETVNYTKQAKLRKIATYYLKLHNFLNQPCRFDVLSIVFTDKSLAKWKIDHYTNAF